VNKLASVISRALCVASSRRTGAAAPSSVFGFFGGPFQFAKSGGRRGRAALAQRLTVFFLMTRAQWPVDLLMKSTNRRQEMGNPADRGQPKSLFEIKSATF
jgi:hypothetical protein